MRAAWNLIEDSGCPAQQFGEDRLFVENRDGKRDARIGFHIRTFALYWTIFHKATPVLFGIAEGAFR